MDLDDLGRATDSQASAVTAWNIPVPASAPSGRASQTNDIVWVFVYVSGTSAAAAPAGWTRPTGALNGAGGIGRYAGYRRLWASGVTDLPLTYGVAVTGTALVLVIPAPLGLSNIIGNSFADIGEIPDPQPIIFAANVGGLNLFVPSSDQPSLSQSNAPNRWACITDIQPTGLPCFGAWGHLGTGPVDQFDLLTPGSNPVWAFQSDIIFGGRKWWVGAAGWS